MKIIVENEKEKQCINVLLQNLHYIWEMEGQDSSAFYKAFEYINDTPDAWKDGKLINDYSLNLIHLLNQLPTIKIEVRNER